MHTIWAVMNDKGEFWKKHIERPYRIRVDKEKNVYDPKTSTVEWIYPDKFTSVLGRAKIFESKRMAQSYCKHDLADARPVKLEVSIVEEVADNE